MNDICNPPDACVFVAHLQCVFGRDSAQDPAREAYITPPDPIAAFEGAAREEQGKGKGNAEWKGKEAPMENPYNVPGYDNL